MWGRPPPPPPPPRNHDLKTTTTRRAAPTTPTRHHPHLCRRVCGGAFVWPWVDEDALLPASVDRRGRLAGSAAPAPHGGCGGVVPLLARHRLRGSRGRGARRPQGRTATARANGRHRPPTTALAAQSVRRPVAERAVREVGRARPRLARRRRRDTHRHGRAERRDRACGVSVRVLLCDADGNLFPSEEPAFDASVVVTNRLMEAIGSPRRFTAEELRLTTTGKNFRTTAADLTADAGSALAANELEHWVELEKREVSAHLGAALRPDARVRCPLARLASLYELAAVSSSAAERLAACFEATGLDELVPAERRCSAEDSLPVPRSKPDPAIYLHTLEALGIEAAEAVAIEDSVPGVESAVAAGIATIGNVMFVPDDEQRERIAALERAGADAVVASWTELEELLASQPIEAGAL